MGAPVTPAQNTAQQQSTESRSKSRGAALWVATMYYAQGLPYSLVRQTAVVFFKDMGLSLQQLGFTSLFGLPWTFKFLWSPFIDGISTKRRWVLAMEFVLALAVALLAASVHFGAGTQLAVIVFGAIATVSATHDIATDGFYLEALDRDDQAKYSGLLVAAYRLAMLTGSGLLVAISGKLSWSATFGIAMLIFAAIFTWHTFMLPKTEKRVVANRVQMVEGFRTFLQLPGIGQAIAFLILFKLGDALLFGMSTPFLLDAGMTKAQLGFYSGVLGIVAAIGTSMFGGWFVSRFRLRRALWVFGIIQNTAIPVYALVAWMKPGIWALAAAVIVEQIAAALGTAAYNNFVMRQNNPNFKATHYAIATGMMQLTTMLGGVLSGFGAQKYGYAIFFTMAFVASLPGLALIPFVARRPECQ